MKNLLPCVSSTAVCGVAPLWLLCVSSTAVSVAWLPCVSSTAVSVAWLLCVSSTAVCGVALPLAVYARKFALNCSEHIPGKVF